MERKRRPTVWTVTNGVIVLCLMLIFASYRFSWRVTGFEGKTIWDWLQLIIVPVALGIVALLLNQANTRTERNLTQRRYELSQMAELDAQRAKILLEYETYMFMLALDRG